ncbi:isoleucine--tRNA ligase [Buchnera aphidicola (Ceratoglyphina bambusae)]|uniref:isoleucine--tRNA ligase n=1 Tax=Buchnera aphidicola TaxID=9 RepID=UPI0031B861D4
MKNYKNTLNLPKTKFSMRADLINKEPKILKKWKKINIYKIIKKKNKFNKKFILQDGPPYANGNIHIGHALNKILKDIIIKYKNLSGMNTLYTPSWDCHGLPIEQKIEEKFKKNNKNFALNKFNKACKKYVLKQIKKQKEEFIKLGIFANWNKSHLTMSFKSQKNVLNKLEKLIEKKYIYSAHKPIHWCIKCQSSLAESELKYTKQKCKTIFVNFKIIKDNNTHKIFKIKKKNKKNIYAVIWTTTPWTLPSNKAISVNPNIYYNLIETKTNNLIIAKEISKKVLKKFKIFKWKIINCILGKKIEFINCEHPFIKKKVPIILSKHVNIKSGTGIVHIAPDHGEEDFNISKKYNIKISNLINKKGYYKKNIHPLLNNKKIFNSNKIIIKILKDKKKIIKTKTIFHKYPFCWRHNYPTIFISRPQWFINLNKRNLKNKIFSEIKKIKWSPKWGGKKIYKMIKNRPDWCISRQRYWGVPITIFINKKNNKMHKNTKKFIKIIKNKIYYKGNEYWHNLKKKIFLKSDHKKFFKSKDVLDVWFDSGSIDVKSIYKNFNKNKSADLYIEGSDQYRGWFMSSLIISVATENISPYKKIISHGFVVDKNGKKMSKSIGNIIEPNSITKKFGADILRLWVASTNYSKEIVISDNVIKNTIDIYRKIRNTIKFIISNIYDFYPNKEKIKYNKLVLIDKWIIGKTKIIQKKIINLYQKYKFYKVINTIIKFFNTELGSFYLDIVKDRLYTLPKKSLERKSCQTSLYIILNAIVIWITPILPFTSDEIWDFVPQKKNKYVFTQKWYKKLKNFSKNEILSLKDWDNLILIKNEVNKKLEESIKKKIVKNSLESFIIIYINSTFEKKIRTLKKEIKFLFITSKVKIKKKHFKEKNSDLNDIKKNLKILIKKNIGKKCNRCWNFFYEKIIKNKKHKSICKRCINNIEGKGEIRKFL